MVIKYGGIIFNHQHFIVFGEAVNLSVSKTKLWLLIHKVICWASKRRIKKILAAANIRQRNDNEYNIQLFRRLKKLNKSLDCVVDGLFIDIDFNSKLMKIGLLMAP